MQPAQLLHLRVIPPRTHHAGYVLKKPKLRKQYPLSELGKLSSCARNVLLVAVMVQFEAVVGDGNVTVTVCEDNRTGSSEMMKRLTFQNNIF